MLAMKEDSPKLLEPYPDNESFISGQKELLVPQFDVWLEKPNDTHTHQVANLYREAYRRGDFFAGRYSDPDNQIFNPEWLKQEFNNPDHKWFVFTNNAGTVIGSTGFFHDYDVGGIVVMTSDETQISLEGRGEHIMDNFFRQIVPRIEASGRQLATDFVLTPQSKGLRRSLQTEFGMTALGIMPHILRHKQSGETRSEITAAKFSTFEYRSVSILADFEPLYRIVKSQAQGLPEPNVLPGASMKTTPFANHYEESVAQASGSDPQQQLDLLGAGYRPVAYYPRFNSFRMAKYPPEMPDLSFILENESIDANKALVEYLKKFLYDQ